MYKGFNLKIEENDFSKYVSTGNEINNENINYASTFLEKFKNKNGDLVADLIMKDWFPPVDVKVFLSHSHKDENLAIGLSGYLFEKFGLRSFIDSCIWGNSADLLKAIDRKYCLDDDGYYNYRKRNRSTSHVHIMLSSALARMIDNTECIFFVNTPHSISTEDYIENQTCSPWIYLEILTTAIVKKKTPKRIRKLIIEKSYRIDSAADSLDNIRYGLDMDHLIDISEKELNRWEIDARFKKDDEALDCLYDLVNKK